MRVSFVCAVAVTFGAFACQSASRPSAPEPPRAPPALAPPPTTVAPVVGPHEYVAKFEATERPGVIVWIDATGALTAARPLDTADPWYRPLPTSGAPIAPDDLAHALLELQAAGGPTATLANRELHPPPPIPPAQMSAREQALEQARAAGILGSTARAYRRPSARARAARASKFLDGLSALAPLVIASPAAPAVVVARTLASTGGTLAVVHDGSLGAFRMVFLRDDAPGDGPAEPWVELRPEADGVHVLVFPAATETVVAYKAGSVDHDALIAATPETHTPEAMSVDVLVRGATTAQQLVDIAVAITMWGDTRYHLAIGEATQSPAQRLAELAAATPSSTPPR